MKLVVHKPKAGEAVCLPRQLDGTFRYCVACCDCGLTHDAVYEVKGTELIVRVWANDEVTEALRKKQRPRRGVRSSTRSSRRG